MAVVINEFLAENNDGIADLAGHQHDWIELKNTGGVTENIAGWYLTDDAGDLTKWQIPSTADTLSLGPGEILLIYAPGDNGEAGYNGSEYHTNFALSQEAGYLGLVRANGTTIEHEFDLYPEQSPDVSYGTGSTDASTSTETLVGNSSSVKYLVPTGENAATDDFWREPGFNTSGWGSGTGGVGKDVNSDSPNFNTAGWIGTNIASQMSNTQRTAYIRYEFDISNPEQLVSLNLDLRMDDGFIVYLNGREMARANFGEDFAQPQPMWNSDAGNMTTGSSANANHVGAEVATPIQFDLTPYLQYLVDDGIVDGNDNVLAFHGVNTASSTTASLQDFLIQPVLTADRATGGSQVGYMAAPTPGRENGVSTLGFVEDTNFSHDRGFYDAAFNLTISTPTAGATIRYTTDGSIPTESSTLYSGPISIDPANIMSGHRGVVTIRAKAFKEDFISTNVDTQTYVFLDKVILQNGSDLAGTYETWGRDKTDADGTDGYNNDDESDWEMDPSIVSGNQTAVKNALTSIPTMSLVMDWDDLFGGDPQPGTPIATGSTVNPATQGIYIVGSSSERQASLEYFNPDNAVDQFQVDTLVELQGHSSSLRWRSDKLSLQVKFRNPLADPELNYPLFDGTPYGEDAVSQFDTFILDAGYNWWWHNNNAAQAADARFVADQVLADLQNAASGDGGHHGKFVNLYINGLYWGIYYAHERPDDSFAAEYYGGNENDYYAIKHASDDPTHAYTWADGGVSAELAYADLLNAARTVGLVPNDTEAYENVEDVLDVEQFIDYMIVHFYGGNTTDWPHNNWYATFNHVDPAGKWRFHAWDQEHAFGSPTADPTGYDVGDDFESPFEIFVNLMENDEFRLKFADRTQALLFDDGALTEANAQAMYEARVDEILEALIAESARWGDNREKDSGTTFTQSHFIADKNAFIASFFPTRSDLIVGDDLGPGLDNWNENGSFFENRNWLVALEAPEFSLSGNMLTLTDPQSSGGTIWYTLDGSDPRNRDTNNQSGTAIQYTGPITLTGSIQVRARIDDGNTGTVDDWSAEVDKSFVVDEEPFMDLRIVELMYNPLGSDDKEYIELMNTGDETIDLTGIRLTNFSTEGYTFTGGTLDPGERIVVVQNQAAFAVAYPLVTNVAPGVFDGSLSNEGETIAIRMPQVAPDDLDLIQRFFFGDSNIDGWPDSPDNFGPSLVYIGSFDDDDDPGAGSPDDPYDNPANWAASFDNDGSPGEEDNPPFLAGDYDGSGTVDDLDFAEWKNDYGLTVEPFTESDGNGDGKVSGADFTVWRENYGASNEGVGSGTGVASAAGSSATSISDELENEVSENDVRSAVSVSAFFTSPDQPIVRSEVVQSLRDIFQRSDVSARIKQELLLTANCIHDRLESAFAELGSRLRQHFDDNEVDTPSDEEAEVCARIWEDKGWLRGLCSRRLG